ncbi:MAG: radical SAM protein, partial [bacterium]|nr:radical SAM protein [bacterium]
VSSDVATELTAIIKEFFNRLKNHWHQLLTNVPTDILGLSVYSTTLPASLFVFHFTRKYFPHIRTIMGGGVFNETLAAGSSNLEVFLEKTEGVIDNIIIGEGENLLLKLVKDELPPRRVYTLKDLDSQTLDLSAALLPDFSDFDPEFYSLMASYTSRGCPFDCSFCTETVRWGKYRKKSGGQVADELEELHERYKSRLFVMSDSLLNPIVSALSKQMEARKNSIYWDGYLRADRHVCKLENTLAWRRGGFYRARLGVESGSQHILNLMGKKITPLQTKEAVSNLANAGIKTTTYWVVGHPDETEEDFQQTLDLITQLKNDIYEADCNPFYYVETGQVDSEKWDNLEKRIPLFPENVTKLTMLKTWILNCEPRREIIYQRINRFVQHCRDLGIPNPYSLQEIHQADKRWQRLHKNAVPSLLELKKTAGVVDEILNVKAVFKAEASLEDEGDFSF